MLVIFGKFITVLIINSDQENPGFATEAIQVMVLPLSQKGEIRAYSHPQNKAAHKVALKSNLALSSTV